jgi:hypothetical protein
MHPKSPHLESFYTSIACPSRYHGQTDGEDIRLTAGTGIDVKRRSERLGWRKWILWVLHLFQQDDASSTFRPWPGLFARYTMDEKELQGRRREDSERKAPGWSED